MVINYDITRDKENYVHRIGRTGRNNKYGKAISIVTPKDEKYLNEKADSAFTCVISKRFYWDWEVKPINYDYKNRPRRQDYKGMLLENGACYINKVGNILKDKNRLSGKITFYEMPEYSSFEIDEPDDFIIIEKLMEKHIND